jgi:hypothetical protein
MFYAGLGNPYILLSLPSGELLFNTVFYVVFLYFAFSTLGFKKRDTLMYVLLIVALQFVLMYAVPGVKGYMGWLVMGFLVSRVAGIYHPPSEIEQPLDNKRIILGWLTLLMFVLCFSASPIDIEVITGK